MGYDRSDRKIKGYENYQITGTSNADNYKRFAVEQAEIKKLVEELAALGCDRIIVEGPAGDNGFRLQLKIWQGRDLAKLKDKLKKN